MIGYKLRFAILAGIKAEVKARPCWSISSVNYILFLRIDKIKIKLLIY